MSEDSNVSPWDSDLHLILHLRSCFDAHQHILLLGQALWGHSRRYSPYSQCLWELSILKQKDFSCFWAGVYDLPQFQTFPLPPVLNVLKHFKSDSDTTSFLEFSLIPHN